MEDEFRLEVWVSAQRSAAKAGTISVERAKRLEALKGWTWDPFMEAWEEGLRQTQKFSRTFRHVQVPAKHVTSDNFRLNAWVNTQRTKAKSGELSAERAKLLNSVAGWTWEATKL